jgi:hypothetical protein
MQRLGEQPMQEEQAKYKYRVVWNEQKSSYEVHAIRPRIFSWLAIVLTQPYELVIPLLQMRFHLTVSG